MPAVAGATLASAYSRSGQHYTDTDLRDFQKQLMEDAIAEERRQDIVDNVWLVSLTAIATLAAVFLGGKVVAKVKDR